MYTQTQICIYNLHIHTYIHEYIQTHSYLQVYIIIRSVCIFVQGCIFNLFNFHFSIYTYICRVVYISVVVFFDHSFAETHGTHHNRQCHCITHCNTHCNKHTATHTLRHTLQHTLTLRIVAERATINISGGLYMTL